MMRLSHFTDTDSIYFVDITILEIKNGFVK